MMAFGVCTQASYTFSVDVHIASLHFGEYVIRLGNHGCQMFVLSYDGGELLAACIYTTPQRSCSTKRAAVGFRLQTA